MVSCIAGIKISVFGSPTKTSLRRGSYCTNPLNSAIKRHDKEARYISPFSLSCCHYGNGSHLTRDRHHVGPSSSTINKLVRRGVSAGKEGAISRDHCRSSHMAWKRASQTGLRCALLRGRSFGNLCDGIPGVRLYHFWDGGGVRVGYLERSVRTFGIGDLSSHGHRQITDA